MKVASPVREEARRNIQVVTFVVRFAPTYYHTPVLILTSEQIIFSTLTHPTIPEPPIEHITRLVSLQLLKRADKLTALRSCFQLVTPAESIEILSACPKREQRFLRFSQNTGG